MIVIFGTSAQPIQYKHCLFGDLANGEYRGDEWQNPCNVTLQRGRDGNELKAQVYVGTCQRNQQQHRVHGQELWRNELQFGQADVSPGNAEARDDHEHDFRGEQDLYRREHVLEATFKDEKCGDSNEREDCNKQTKEEPFVCFVTVDGWSTRGGRTCEGSVAGPPLLDTHSNVLIQTVDDASSDDTVDDGARKQVGWGRPC